ncbi:MAG: 4-hydroxy-tetrahydrodipicolinate reductase [Gemmatimonadota bacterium]|nr:MAG: 4-hydroxy-tetrahydrodipicolinate reductase [Gemmatimonadota bacterium]
MRIALVGYGRMGRAVEQVATERGHEVVARIDLEDNPDGRGITSEGLNGAAVAVEFSVPEAAPRNLAALAACGVDAVAGTTGWYDQLDEVRAAVEAAGTGLVYAPNFSLGMQLFFRVARQAGHLCDRLDDYDAFILEAHHRHKQDHPSGTARKLAEILLAELSRKTRWELGPGEGPADPSVLQVTAVRAGEIPGTHTLGLEGPDDRIEIRHEAKGRTGFARGAVAAAEWIQGRSGVFTLDDMLAETWS